MFKQWADNMYSLKSDSFDLTRQNVSDVSISQDRILKQWVEKEQSSIQITSGYDLRKGGSN